MARERVGIRQVAEAAGVSMTTVSHVLNETPHVRVSEATRERVKSAARELEYRPNRLAQGLRTRTSGMVGLLTEEIAATPHAGRIILGAQEAAARHNLTLAIINSPLLADADARRDDVRALLDRHVDAVIYATVFHHVVHPPAELLTVPSVLIGAVDHKHRLSSVLPNEQAGAVAAVDLLLAHGHTRIGFTAPLEDVPATRGRRRGYELALAAAGLPLDGALIAVGPSEAWGGYAAASTLLDLPERPTAIFAYNDRMAMGVYRAANERGLQIPRDLSVIGFDDQDPIAASLYPGLTTIGLPQYEMGAWAVDRLAEHSTDGADRDQREEVLLDCRVVVRASVAGRPAD
jgi:LacI family transcriptional regulator